MNYKTWCTEFKHLEFMSKYLCDENIISLPLPIGIRFNDNRKCVGFSKQPLFAELKDAFVDVEELAGVKCNDPVNHPSHYASTKVECIDAMEQMFGRDAVIRFAALNCFKYLWRRKDKDNEDQDIKKALWYFDKVKELINK